MTHTDSTESWVERGRDYLVAHGYAADTFKVYRATTRRFLAFLTLRRVGITNARRAHVSSFLEAERRRFKLRPWPRHRRNAVARYPCS